MNSILKSLRLPKSWLKNNAILITAVRSHFNKDYKPGPYPRTKKERIAAAEKYGILYSEYKPYPDDGGGYGDYPDLPLISADSKDPFYPWDSPELKRNFNEPLHVEFDLVREDRYDVSLKLRRPMWFQLAQCLGAIFGYYALYALCEKAKMFPAVLPKQYPGDGRKHYTFETKS
ncbi:hypothetical protein NQ314_000566 [Rhamnusium bicolor]|uniref:NADH dehydrogenase [ubiquinone] 1 beta subcomplex subunit 8, mitochondrial n=1 Tax=Rhamnusium bicolor TaxID=1586634 RepID=A0AAV8ZWE4_9CUCU|nr:hypothetical protein NQ314_000566 [Rhamnusium bicolor]